jgi:hypothetical protein
MHVRGRPRSSFSRPGFFSRPRTCRCLAADPSGFGDGRCFQPARSEAIAVDRFALLGFEDRADAPRWLQRIQGPDGLRRVNDALCAAAGPDAELRVSARIATRRGWQRLLSLQGNICAAVPRASVP